MEARNIKVILTRSQQSVVIKSAATTLKELKADLDKAHIDYSGMTFHEGLSHTDMRDDNAVLPTNLPWKGQITNNLVFMLSEPRKKIRNGAVASRSEAYTFIKKNNLGDAFAAKYNVKNYTNGKTADLIEFCNVTSKKAAPVKKTVPTKKTAEKKVANQKPVNTAKPAENNLCCLHMQNLVSVLIKKGIVTKDEIQTGETTPVTNVSFTDAECKEMFKEIN
jgi:hypothetical protein